MVSYLFMLTMTDFAIVVSFILVVFIPQFFLVAFFLMVCTILSHSRLIPAPIVNIFGKDDYK